MTEALMRYDTPARVGTFVAVLAFLALLELLFPRRSLSVSKRARWLQNLGLVGLSALVLRVVFPASAVGVAFLAGSEGWGLLNRAELPGWLALGLSLVALDFVVYLQHVLFHAVPALWRLHMVHHADLDFDVTTGNRFHPIEILVSTLWKAGAIVVLGPSALAVLLFELILNAAAMFNHSNVRIPAAVDRALRWLIVTPDMHRVHHSVVPVETNSNFGFNLPWWDRLLGTYREQPQGGHEGMTLGLRQFRVPEGLTFPKLLAMPFTGELGPYSFQQSRPQR